MSLNSPDVVSDRGQRKFRSISPLSRVAVLARHRANTAIWTSEAVQTDDEEPGRIKGLTLNPPRAVPTSQQHRHCHSVHEHMTNALSRFSDGLSRVVYATGTLWKTTPDSSVKEGRMAICCSRISFANGFSILYGI